MDNLNALFAMFSLRKLFKNRRGNPGGAIPEEAADARDEDFPP